jgi:uncharacterized protein (DUF305 family)
MSDTSHAQMSDRKHGGGARSYLMFWIMMALSFVVMYAAMFTMIDGWGDFRNNLNMFYMTVTMWAPMGIIMLLAMRGMYRNTKANVAMLVVFAVLAVASFAATRTQALIDDGQFIDSMIPHHSGAILMCREAALSDPELVELCDEIASGQRAEIEQMEQIRDRLDQ